MKDDLEISDSDYNISANSGEDIIIEISDDQAALDTSDIYISTDSNVIDLSGVTTTLSPNYSISGAAGTSYNWGNIAAGNVTIGSFEFDDTRTSDIIIRKDGDAVGIKLLATLELWSDILGLPLVRDGEFQHEMLAEIHKSWVDSARAGDIEQAKKYRDQFEVFDQLTKNDKKDDSQ